MKNIHETRSHSTEKTNNIVTRTSSALSRLGDVSRSVDARISYSSAASALSQSAPQAQKRK